MVRIECVCVYVYLFIHLIYMFGCIRTHTYMYTLESIYAFGNLSIRFLLPSIQSDSRNENEWTACGVWRLRGVVPSSNNPNRASCTRSSSICPSSLWPSMAISFPQLTYVSAYHYVDHRHAHKKKIVPHHPTETYRNAIKHPRKKNYTQNRDYRVLGAAMRRHILDECVCVCEHILK